MNDRPRYREFRVISPEGEPVKFKVNVPSEEELEAIMRPKESEKEPDARLRLPESKKQKTARPVVNDRFSESLKEKIPKLSVGQIAIIFLIISLGVEKYISNF